jgi:spermidine/putrescine transport system permease protein
MRRRNWGWLTVVPGVLWLIAMVAIPLALMVVYSFSVKLKTGTVEPEGFTWANYARLIDPLYFRIFRRSFVQAVMATGLCILLGYPLAYLIARSPVGRRERLLLLVIIPFWTNFLVRTFAWLVLLRRDGVINNLLQALHLTKEPLDLLYNEGAVQVGLVYTLLPLMILPLYSTLEKLDQRLLDAASDLGAPPRRAFWSVTFPLSIPGVTAGGLMVFIAAFGMFVVSDMLGGAKTVLVGNLIQNQFGTARNWAFGATVSVALTVVVIILALIIQRVGKLDEGGRNQ